MLRDSFNGALDGGRVDQGAHRVMHENDVIGRCIERAQGSGNRLLPRLAAGDNAHLPGEAVLRELRADVLALRRTNRQRHGRDARLVSECSDAVDQDGHTAQGKELLGGDTGHCHARAQPRCWKNCVNSHRR